jgi:hypothetical protein
VPENPLSALDPRELYLCFASARKDDDGAQLSASSLRGAMRRKQSIFDLGMGASLVITCLWNQMFTLPESFISPV